MSDPTQENCPPQPNLFDILNQAEVARGLGVTLRTMQRYEALGIGPPKISLGKKPLYRRVAVEQWLAAREKHQPGDMSGRKLRIRKNGGVKRWPDRRR